MRRMGSSADDAIPEVAEIVRQFVKAGHVGHALAKPFDLDVLTAKVQALLRRTYDFAAASPVLSHRGAVLQTGDQSLLVDGEKLPLSKNEYRILWTLLQDKGKIVSRRLTERLYQICIEKPKPQIQFAVWKGRNEHRG